MSRIEVGEIVSTLQVFTALDVAKILFALYPNHCSNLHSFRIQVQKELNRLVALGKLKRGKGFYYLPHYKGEYGEHDQLKTYHIAEFLKLNLPLKAYREVITPIGLRADLICLIEKNNQALCFILEVAHTETPDYLRQKYNAWMTWDGAIAYLSKLFSHPVPYFSFVVAGNTVLPDVVTFDELLREVKGE
jgi:hypothetical protein